MKYALFAAIAFVATGASAQTIKVTSELSMNGKLIETFTGSKPAGETQSYGDLKEIPYKKVSKQAGSKVTVGQGLYETGFHMDITPVITSDGAVRYRLSASQKVLTKLEPQNVGGMEVELPIGTHDSFTLTMSAKPGEAREYPFGFDDTTGSNKYMLRVAAEPQPD